MKSTMKFVNGSDDNTHNYESQYYYDGYYDNYSYPYNISINTYPIEELVPVSIMYGLTLILGVVGNILVIVSILRIRRMRNVTNIFLTSLASADLMLVLICVPIKFAKWFSFTWDFGEFLCKAVHYLQSVSVISSVLTLTTISLERYYAILHPMQARSVSTVSHARMVIGIIWLMSFILAAPIIYGQVLHEVGILRKGFWCIKIWPHARYEKAYELGMLCLVFIIPLTIMTWAYASIGIELWIVTSRRATLGQRGSQCSAISTHSRVDDDHTRKQVIKMLVAIIVLFAICHGPSLIDNVLVSFGYIDQLNYGNLKYMRQAFALMSYFNSCINPIVYAFMSQSFRKSFKYALCVCSHDRNLPLSTA